MNLPSSSRTPPSFWARPGWGRHLCTRAGKGLRQTQQRWAGGGKGRWKKDSAWMNVSIWWKSRVTSVHKEFKWDESSVCEWSRWTGSLKSFKHMWTSDSLPNNWGTVARCEGAQTGLVVKSKAKIVASHTLWNQQVFKRIHRHTGRGLPADYIFLSHYYCKNMISSTVVFCWHIISCFWWTSEHQCWSTCS